MKKGNSRKKTGARPQKQASSWEMRKLHLELEKMAKIDKIMAAALANF